MAEEAEGKQRSSGTRKKSASTGKSRSSARTQTKKPSSGTRRSGSAERGGQDGQKARGAKDADTGSEEPTQEQKSAEQEEPADQGEQEPADQNEQEATAERAESDEKEDTAEPPSQLSGVEMVKRGKKLLTKFTGHRPESVSGLDRHGDGWRLTLEVVELRRIPPSTDVLGSYQLDMTEDGELAGYRRTHRYLRNQTQQRSE